MRSKYFKGYTVYENGVIIGKHGKELKVHKGTTGYINANLYEQGKQKT